MNQSLSQYIRATQNGNKRKYAEWNQSFINRLGITYELEGHDGCVNCLEWSRDGTRLLSGSDDLTVRMWTPFRQVVKKVPKQPVSCSVTYSTPHHANIFDVKFIQEESIIVTCAADGLVCKTDVENQSSSVLWKTEGRMKKIARYDQFSFFVACENGKVYTIDLRDSRHPQNTVAEYECTEGEDQPKCLDYNLQNGTLAVGYTCSVVRLFDLRLSKKVVDKYSPGSLAFSKKSESMRYHVTDVRFNETGRELIVNMGNDHLYVFDTNNKRHTVMELPDIQGDEIDFPHLTTNAEKLKNEGNKAFREEEFWLAEQLYSQALYTANNHPVLLSNSCAALSHRRYKGDHYHGFRQAKRALSAAPHYKKCRVKAIQAMAELKLWQHVINEYDKLLAENDLTVKEKARFKKEILNAEKQIAESSTLNDRSKTIETHLTENNDYNYRFVGHSNAETDIKEAAFLGKDYIAAGSDCGNMFIWHRSGRLVYIAKADNAIVNCIQPNKFASYIATSGIDNDVRIWAPMKDADAFTLETDPTFMVEQSDINQRQLSGTNFIDRNLISRMFSRIDVEHREPCASQ